MPDDIVLDVVEEHPKSDLNPLHTWLEMGSPIVRQHHGNSIREPDASLIRDLYRRGPFLVETDVQVGGKPWPDLFDQAFGKVPDPDKVGIIGRDWPRVGPEPFPSGRDMVSNHHWAAEHRSASEHCSRMPDLAEAGNAESVLKVDMTAEPDALAFWRGQARV